MNGLGHRVWAKTQARKLSLNPRKLNEMLAEHIKEMKTKSEQREAWDAYWNVIQAANMARCLGYVPEKVFPNATRLVTAEELEARLEEKPTAIEWELIDWLLTNSIAAAYKGYIDYNDQIYMPALFGGSFPNFPLVLVDEKQDLNPLNHQMLSKLVRGRIISVGDPYQSIYAFRGALPNGMAISATKFQMAQYDLSVSFRCPAAVVENVLWRVPWFKASKAGGHVETLNEIAIEDIQEGSAIICRNNAPLFALAFRLLKAKRSVNVSGSEIGPKLIGIMKRLGDGNMSQAMVYSSIMHWKEERLRKGSTTAADMAECMAVFAEYGQTLDQAVAYAEFILKQEGSIKLMTGHKAKGLEFDVVYHLDRHLIRLGEEQEDNLRYVIDTRAKDELYYITSAGVI
jgi:superfamily I DNA/RNA helicase